MDALRLRLGIVGWQIIIKTGFCGREAFAGLAWSCPKFHSHTTTAASCSQSWFASEIFGQQDMLLPTRHMLPTLVWCLLRRESSARPVFSLRYSVRTYV